jgi:hypothetical protein
MENILIEVIFDTLEKTKTKYKQDLYITLILEDINFRIMSKNKHEIN